VGEDALYESLPQLLLRSQKEKAFIRFIPAIAGAQALVKRSIAGVGMREYA